MSVSEVEEVFYVPTSVDVYRVRFDVSSGRQVLASSDSQASFRIFTEKATNAPGHAPQPSRVALIKCRTWYYPLEFGKTVIYRSKDKKSTYIFPDTAQDFFVIVVFPADVDVTLFEDIVQVFARIEDVPDWWRSVSDVNYLTTAEPTAPPLEEYQTPDQRSSRAESMANGLVAGAEYLNTGLTKGTEVAARLVQKGAQPLKQRGNEPGSDITAANGGDKQIDPRVISTLKGLRVASEVAVTVSGYCASAVSSGAQAVGKWMAPHVKKHGTTLVSSVSGQDPQSSSRTVDNVLTVAAGGLQGFGTLYSGLVENAKVLGKTIAAETCDVVHHKYGKDAAVATHDALFTVGNAALTVNNVESLGVKGIAKKTAIQGAKEVIKQHNDKKQDGKSQGPGGNGTTN